VPNVNDVGRNIETQILPCDEFSLFTTPQLTLLLGSGTERTKGVARTFTSPVIALGPMLVPKEIYVFLRPDNK
jgi:hypothetical protein